MNNNEQEINALHDEYMGCRGRYVSMANDKRYKNPTQIIKEFEQTICADEILPMWNEILVANKNYWEAKKTYDNSPSIENGSKMADARARYEHWIILYEEYLNGKRTLECESPRCEPLVWLDEEGKPID